MPTTMEDKVRAVVAAELGMAAYFLKIDGIPGESQDKQHKNEIDVLSFSWWNVSSTTGVGTGGGGKAGKVTFQDLQFVAAANKAGPQLMLSCATGKHIPRAILTGRRRGGREQQDFLKVTLENVIVSSYAATGSTGDGAMPLDTATLKFGKIEVEYKEVRADGSIGETVKVSYDIGKNSSV